MPSWLLHLISHILEDFPLCLVEIKTLPSPVLTLGMVCFFLWFFLQLWIVSLQVSTDWYSSENLRVTFLKFLEGSLQHAPFSIILFSLVFYLVNFSSFGFLKSSTLSSAGESVSISVSLSCIVAWKLSPGSKLKQWWSLPLVFFVFQELLPCATCVYYPKTALLC